MIDKLKDITERIDERNPFSQCALGREKFGNALQTIVEDAVNGVIAINGEWGSGKTTFLEMWRRMIEQQGFKTIYVNVWENDFVEDPIIPMLAQLEGFFKEKGLGALFGEFTDAAGRITFTFLKHLIYAPFNKIGIDGRNLHEDLKEDLKESKNKLNKVGDEIIKNFIEQKKYTDAFKGILEKIVNQSNSDSEHNENSDLSNQNHKPLIFIIDEIDRCNPAYAVKVLERIKYLFSVKGLVFVLAIDKKALECAIRGYYGSNLIDASEYLKRFIDLELKLPKYNSKKFIGRIFDEMNFKNLFDNRAKINKTQYIGKSSLKNEKENLEIIVSTLFNKTSIQLRTLEKIMSYLKLVLQLDHGRSDIAADGIFVLLYIKFLYPDVFRKILNREFTLQELLNHLSDMFGVEFFKDGFEIKNKRMLLSRIIDIVCLYNYNDTGQEYEDFLFNQDKESIIIPASFPREDWQELISHYKSRYQDMYPLQSTLRTIEYIDSIID